MASEVFHAKVEWKRAPDEEGLSYSRDHRIFFPGKEDLQVSSGTALRGNPKLLCPEELMAGAAASCQMMTYLYLCARSDIVVNAYRDEAEAYLGIGPKKKPWIERVLLRPRITFQTSESQQFRAMAIRLVHEAHDECYLTNSLRCPVDIEPLFVWV